MAKWMARSFRLDEMPLGMKENEEHLTLQRDEDVIRSVPNVTKLASQTMDWRKTGLGE